MKLLLIILISFFIGNILPQDLRILEKTDELRKKVLNGEGKDKLKAYIELIDFLKLNQPDKALLESDSIFTLAKKLNNKKALTNIYLILGDCNSEIHKNELALKNFEKGLKLSNNLKDSSQIAKFLIKIGKLQISSGNLDEALKNFDNALDISKRNEDTNNQIMAFNYLGILNYILDNLKEAEDLSIKALELSQKHNYQLGSCLANEHLAIIRIKQGRFKEALSFNRTAYDISLQLDFIVNIPDIYFNYSVIYNRLGDYDKAMEYLNKSEKIRNSFGDFRGIASDNSMMGSIYLTKKDYKKAIEKFLKSHEILKEYNALRPLISALNGLAIAYENIGNYKLALEYYKEYTVNNDSMLNENVKRQIAISNAKKLLEEKERRIDFLEELNKSQIKTQRYLLGFSSVILTLFIISIVLYLKIRKSKQNLAEINQKLILFNKEREKFFSIISHDLKSPFLGILGLTELLKEEINSLDIKKLKELVEKLDKALNNQYKLVENLLHWTLIQSGKMIYEPTEFILTEVINNVTESLKNFSSQKGVRIKTNLEDNFIVRADKNMISSVLMNLIANAIKYSYSDSDVWVILTEKSGNLVSVQIKDSGVGIPEENISKIFGLDGNKSTEGTEKERGTGLGLLIVKEMLLKNGSDIKFTSKENIGSVFEFTLPLVQK